MPSDPEPHADHRLVARVKAALDCWLADGEGEEATSQITGGGAVSALERLMSRMHGNRPALLLPSGTYALRVALAVGGVEPGDDVLVPAVDSPASWAAVLSIGARPVPVPVDLETLTIDAAAAVAARTRRTKVVIACHLHGVPADVPALRRALPGLVVIEDCAQALGSTLDGQAVGTFGDAAVFSLGPLKPVDAGEGGVLVLSDLTMYRAAVRSAGHPVRQVLSGVVEPELLGFSLRPHPVAAILGWHAFRSWDADRARSLAARLVDRLARVPGIKAFGHDGRRRSAGPGAAVLLARGRALRVDGVTLRPTGAQVLGWTTRRALTEMLARTYLARVLLARRRGDPEVEA